MLYVSRYIGVDKYGVVDTDDGIEDVVSLDDVEDAIVRQKLKISGAVLGRNSAGRTFVDVARPFQSDDTKTSYQVYVKREHFVEVNVFNSAISCICASSRRIKRPVSIRLSDFATACGDCVLSANAPVSFPVMMLVFDDKLRSVTDLSFRMANYGAGIETYGIGAHGLVFDLRQLSNNALAFQIYKQLAEYPRNPFGCVRDNATRLAKAYNMFGES